MTDWDRPARLLKQLRDRVRNLEAREETGGVVQAVLSIAESSADDDSVTIPADAAVSESSADDETIAAAGMTGETMRWDDGRWNLDHYD